jgi:hypothetical protein
LNEISVGINEVSCKLPFELKEEITTKYNGKSENKQIDIPIA